MLQLVLSLRKPTPVVAQVDGKNGFDFLAASMGMTAAVEMARTFGIGIALHSLATSLVLNGLSDKSDVGHFLIIIKPDLFMSLEEFRTRIEYLYQRVANADRAADVDRIYFPGEIERLVQAEREKTGIPLVKAEMDALNAEARRVGRPPLLSRRFQEP
ncbi:hypothetical protein HD806DRAFT_522240 [Xylariaceae sp. AK1471]|nr:hypothetical protein HD806DRAFT_522240 [Xylariaceae sp. AK1471]